MKKVFAKKDKSNVRELPNTESQVLYVLSTTEGLEYKTTTPAHNGKTWYAVKFGNSTGYVRSDVAEVKETDSKEKYKNVIIRGSTFPDKTYTDEASISLSPEILKEYIPEINKLNLTKGFRLLLISMANINS